MHSGSELIETWIPTGGFKLERRKARTPDGAVFAECLVPKWEIDDLMADRPCTRQTCLHRIVADCPPERIRRQEPAIASWIESQSRKILPTGITSPKRRQAGHLGCTPNLGYPWMGLW